MYEHGPEPWLNQQGSAVDRIVRPGRRGRVPKVPTFRNEADIESFRQQMERDMREDVARNKEARERSARAAYTRRTG